MGVVLDFLFDVVVEHVLFGTGARLLWLLRLGRVPMDDQRQHGWANVIAGAAAWAALAALAIGLAP